MGGILFCTLIFVDLTVQVLILHLPRSSDYRSFSWKQQETETLTSCKSGIGSISSFQWTCNHVTITLESEPLNQINHTCGCDTLHFIYLFIYFLNRFYWFFSEHEQQTSALHSHWYQNTRDNIAPSKIKWLHVTLTLTQNLEIKRHSQKQWMYVPTDRYTLCIVHTQTLSLRLAFWSVRAYTSLFFDIF